MPTCHLTGDFVRRLSHEHHEKRTLYFDADIKGFLLELRQSGSGTYYFRYRSGPGRSTLLRLGRLSEITLNEARFRAYQAWKSCQNGDEPVNPPLFQDTPSLKSSICPMPVRKNAAGKRKVPSYVITFCRTSATCASTR